MCALYLPSSSLSRPAILRLFFTPGKELILFVFFTKQLKTLNSSIHLIPPSIERRIKRFFATNRFFFVFLRNESLLPPNPPNT